jgi:ketosteroid isomerase-like protein
MSGATAIANRWIELYNDTAPGTYGSDRFPEVYAEDFDWREMPSAFAPAGRSGDKQTLREALAHSRSSLVDRHVTLQELIADAEDRRCVIRYRWQATLQVDMPMAAAGTRLSFDVAQVIEVRDGLIVRSMEYIAPSP